MAITFDGHSRILLNDWQSGAIYGLVAVPEPSAVTLAMMASAVLPLCIRRWRCRVSAGLRVVVGAPVARRAG